jgi:hypothetical protein
VKHFASRAFWSHYHSLPAEIQRKADRAFQLLKQDPRHPSLYFKKVGRFWSVRVGAHHRALAVETEDNLVWFWIGTHTDYDKHVG